MQLRLVTLGAVRCFRDGTELGELPAQRLRCAVLVYLATERETTRESLTALLWPDRDSDRARHAFNQKLYELRQVLGDEWLESQGERLRVAPVLQVDARDFEIAAERGALEEALSLYQGAFLAGFYLPESVEFDHWVDRHRARLARAYRKVCGDFIDQCVTRGDVERAIAEARRWVELEPAEDTAQHRLIELLAASGNRAEAIRQYESYERALKADDLEPLEHTRGLIERVRQSSAAPPSAAVPPVQRPESGPPAPPVATAPARALPRWRRRQVTFAATAAALLLAGAGWWTAHRYVRAPSTPPRSIAVLPFLNLSTDPGASEHLSDGIAEDLITALSQTDSLHVAARTSSFRFRHKDLSVPTIGDSLHVALLLEGSVRQEGTRLRVTAQLIKTSDGYHLWSQTFDRELKDVLSVQEELANAIVDALRIRLAGPDRTRLAVGGTRNTRAYQLFLRGRHLLQKATRAAVMQSFVYLDSAVAQDPGYALAHAALAEAYALAATRDLPRREALDTARSLAQRAIRLTPRLSDAHAALGRVELERWNWSEAEREARLAIQLDPKNSSAHATYTRVLMVQGRTDEAVREGALAVELEPLSAAAAENYAQALRAARQFPRAVEMYRKAIELEPNLGRQNLAKAYIELGHYDSALAQFRAAVTAGAPHLPMIELLWSAYTNARAGQGERARAVLREFEGAPLQGQSIYLQAATYLALGDKEQAFQLLERGVRNRSQAAWRQLPWDPIWDPIRQEPRFHRILLQLKE
ncbi:MAG: hypothetical protein HY560_07065 [Gemmatimonadetes bacterium]|nr:hypothetical protein [Gemmatimonadota bacterium]